MPESVPVEEAGIEDSVKIAYVSLVHAESELEHTDLSSPNSVAFDIEEALAYIRTAKIWLRHWAEQNNG